MSKFNIGDKVEVLEQSPFGIGIINVGDIVTVTAIRGPVLSLTNSKGDLQITRDDRGNLRRIPTREDIKKGDKVRILSCDSGRTDEVGQIVEVVAIMSSSLYPIYIKTEPDFTGAAFYGFEEVEKVEEEENVKQESRGEEFKIGDKVEILNEACFVSPICVGDILEITDIAEDRIYITDQEGDEQETLMGDGDIKLVDETPKDFPADNGALDSLLLESYRQAGIALKTKNPALAMDYIDVINKLNKGGI